VFDLDEHTDCTKGTQDANSLRWSNVVYDDEQDREYDKHAAGFEPSSLEDCYAACAKEAECGFFWYGGLLAS
jgi:hypothetical protein